MEAAIQAEQAAENPPQAEEDLLTAAVNRAILTGFSTLYQELVEKEHLVPVTDPDFELLAVNRAEGFRAGAEFYCLPPLELAVSYTHLDVYKRQIPSLSSVTIRCSKAVKASRTMSIMALRMAGAA